MFQKNRPKTSPRLKSLKALAQMALCANLNEFKVQRLQKILAQKAAAKSTLIAKLFQFSQGHPKPAFSEKVQRGHQGKFFKSRPNGSPRIF